MYEKQCKPTVCHWHDKEVKYFLILSSKSKYINKKTEDRSLTYYRREELYTNT